MDADAYADIDADADADIDADADAACHRDFILLLLIHHFLLVWK